MRLLWIHKVCTAWLRHILLWVMQVYTWNLVQDMRIIPKNGSKNQMHAVQPYCFSLYQTKGSYKLQWGCTLRWAEVLTNSTKNALSSSVGWLEAVHHCSLKMKEENPFCRVNRQVLLFEPNESCYKKSKVWKVQPKSPRSRTSLSQMVLCLWSKW